MWWPDYAGNNMFNCFGNLAVDSSAALLFVGFDTGRTLQLAGTAAIEWDDLSEPGDHRHTGRRASFHTQQVGAGRLAGARPTKEPNITDTLTDDDNGATALSTFSVHP